MKKDQSSFLFALATSVVLLGAGCSFSPEMPTAPKVIPVPAVSNTVTTPSAPAPSTASTSVSVLQPLSCASGTVPFIAANLNVEFCYPTDDGSGHKITVKEESNGVLLLVDGVKTRKVGVLTIPAGQTAKSFMTANYISTKAPLNAVCSLTESTGQNRISYEIVGEINGEQNLDSMGACTQNASLVALFDGLAVGSFFIDTRSPSTLFFWNGEQEPSLGYLHTDDFHKSIQPKI